jgi:hypothetical protein
VPGLSRTAVKYARVGPRGRFGRQVTGRGEAPASGVAVHVEDGPGPFGIHPWLLVGVGAISEVARGRARPVWASAPLLTVFIASVLAAIWFGFRRGRGDRLAVGPLVALTVDAFVLARRLRLSESTVRNHLSAAIGKTGSRNRIEAVRAARHNGRL